MNNKDLKEYITGIVAENKVHPPVGKKIPCGGCRKYILRTTKCKEHPEGIPTEIMARKVTCPKFQQK